MTGMLEGLTVADFSIVTAGAAATQVLADFGADVIKVESESRPDMYRGGIKGNQGGLGDLDFPPFRTANRNKRALAVELKTGEGHEIARRLIARCDVVVENFRRGVLERLGLGFEELIAINPNIVLVSISSQGATGPNRGYTSFGTTLDALAGVMSITGYDQNTPTWSSGRINYPDQTANSLAPALILAAVMAAREDGEPRWVDMSQREVVTSLLGERILEVSLGAPDPEPIGNVAPGTIDWLSRSNGEDHWIAITLDSEQAIEAAGRLVGAELGGVAGEARVVAVRSAVDTWAASRSREQAAAELQAAGVAAVPVRSGEELLDDPFLAQIGWWQQVELPDGRVERERGWVVNFDDGGPVNVRRRAPHVGEDTDAVLAELGYGRDKIAALHQQGVVTSPQTLNE